MPAPVFLIIILLYEYAPCVEKNIRFVDHLYIFAYIPKIYLYRLLACLIATNTTRQSMPWSIFFFNINDLLKI